MTAIRGKWLVWLAVLVAVAGGLWFAHARGWLSPVYDWVRCRFAGDQKTASNHAHQGMNMPGMDEGSMASPGMSSKVHGHAKVNIPGEVRQLIGVTVGEVKQAPLRMSIRTVGIVRPDETRIAHVHLRTEGWVEKVFVDYVGQKVAKGGRLLSIYSPDFVSTQQDYLNARQAGRPELARLARQRLELWGVPKKEIDALDKKNATPQVELILRSPLEGTVLTRNGFAGQYVTPKTELYVVADLSTVWVQAKVYEYELPHVAPGQPAKVTLPALPGRELTGKVVFIQPTVEERPRTVEVRVELPNRDGLLKPGMFAHITIDHDMGKGLLVPTSAIIRTGERDIAYRVEGKGLFVPVEVSISPYQFGDHFRILKGLKAGDRVSTSANFLIDSESRLRVGGMAGMPGMDRGGNKGR